MTDITPKRLAQIKALADKANAGTWVTDGELIEAVTQDIPDLIAALEAAQAENAKLRAILWEAAKASIIVANITETNVSEEVWKHITDATTAALESNP